MDGLPLGPQNVENFALFQPSRGQQRLLLGSMFSQRSVVQVR